MGGLPGEPHSGKKARPRSVAWSPHDHAVTCSGFFTVKWKKYNHTHLTGPL